MKVALGRAVKHELPPRSGMAMKAAGNECGCMTEDYYEGCFGTNA